MRPTNGLLSLGAPAAVAVLLFACELSATQVPLSPPLARELATVPEPTNLSLISAMPSTVESVLVLRPLQLIVDGSLVSQYADIERWPRIEGGGPTDLLTVVYAEVGSQDPRVLVRGASNIRRPQGLGLGAYHECDIFWVGGSLAKLREHLLAGRDIEGLRTVDQIGDTHVFAAKVSAVRDDKDRMAVSRGEPHHKEDRFVAVVDDHTVVVCSRFEDVAAVVRSLSDRHRNVVMPERWQAAAKGLPLESPLVILRRYDLQNQEDMYSPESLRRQPSQRAGLTSLGLALTDPVAGKLTLHGITDTVDQALKVLGSVHFLPYTRYDWKVKPEDAGFVAELIRHPRPDDGSFGLKLWVLWGPNVAI